jgi:hypothetical protein
LPAPSPSLKPLISKGFRLAAAFLSLLPPCPAETAKDAEIAAAKVHLTTLGTPSLPAVVAGHPAIGHVLDPHRFIA